MPDCQPAEFFFRLVHFPASLLPDNLAKSMPSERTSRLRAAPLIHGRLQSVRPVLPTGLQLSSKSLYRTSVPCRHHGVGARENYIRPRNVSNPGAELIRFCCTTSSGS
jgi:hypothetical protein